MVEHIKEVVAIEQVRHQYTESMNSDIYSTFEDNATTNTTITTITTTSDCGIHIAYLCSQENILMLLEQAKRDEEERRKMEQKAQHEQRRQEWLERQTAQQREMDEDGLVS